MWPFDHGVILTLYLGTLALHAVFVGYVVIGSAYALVRPHDPVAATVRDRLPFMLGCGITAGVGPLLFIQLLHQRRFYTANLLLGPRWFAVVPALVVGFYALYLAKASERLGRAALAVALLCFVFVAWSWSELHELMQADAGWAAFYAAGDRVFTAATVAPRFVIAVGAMAALFAVVAAWAADASGRSRVAWVAAAGRVVSVLGAVWLWRAGFSVSGPAVAWFGILVAASVVDTVAWLVATRRATDRVLAVATAGGAAALIAAAVVREAPRLGLIESHPQAEFSGGAVTFFVALVLAIAAIAWVARQVRA
jgi:hypothetical protein